jgi:RNA polymerase subunit RPABC4/transcription elongation factor Spt4
VGIAHLVSLRTATEWPGTVAILAPQSTIAGTIRRLERHHPAEHAWSKC